jgi:valyl-tRNA synthetase
MGELIALITSVRNIRAEMNIPAGAALTLHIATANQQTQSVVRSNIEHVKRLARISTVSIGEALPELGSACRGVVAGMEIAVPLADLIDTDKERERLSRELTRKQDEARSLAGRLDNHSFRERAPKEVVQQTRARHDELIAEIGKLRATLQAIG